MNKKDKNLLQNGLLNDLGMNTPNHNQVEHKSHKFATGKQLHTKSHTKRTNKWQQFKKMLKK